MCAHIFWTPRFFHMCSRIFLFPLIFPFMSRYSKTMTSAPFSLHRTAYFQRPLTLSGPCSRPFLRMRPSTFHRRSFSSAKSMNFLAQTVPSASMMLHTASEFSPRSTAHILCSCAPFAGSALSSRYENRR